AQAPRAGPEASGCGAGILRRSEPGPERPGAQAPRAGPEASGCGAGILRRSEPGPERPGAQAPRAGEGSLKPAPFEYHAPETVADAVGLLAEYADDVKPLAGGQSLVPMLALRLTRFAHLVDLNRIPELTGVERTNGTLTIRAMTRQRAIERDAQVA